MEGFYSKDDIMEMLGVGQTKAYAVIAKLKEELEDQGWCMDGIGGKIQSDYFHKRFNGVPKLKKAKGEKNVTKSSKQPVE